MPSTRRRPANVLTFDRTRPRAARPAEAPAPVPMANLTRLAGLRPHFVALLERVAGRQLDQLDRRTAQQ